MVITPKNKLQNHPIANIKIQFNDEPLKQSHAIKMLGVTVDRKLTFSDHIKDMMKIRLRKYIPIFYKLRCIMSTKKLLLIYYSNSYSCIKYCILIYGTANRIFIEKLDRLHKRILKVIFSTSSDKLSDYMLKNKILDLTSIYKYQLLMLAHKTIHNCNILPSFLKSQYNSKSNFYINLRNNDDFKTPFYRTTTGQNCIDKRLATEWNNIPTSFKVVKNFKIFKKIIKDYLIHRINIQNASDWGVCAAHWWLALYCSFTFSLLLYVFILSSVHVHTMYSFCSSCYVFAAYMYVASSFPLPSSIVRAYVVMLCHLTSPYPNQVSLSRNQFSLLSFTVVLFRSNNIRVTSNCLSRGLCFLPL